MLFVLNLSLPSFLQAQPDGPILHTQEYQQVQKELNEAVISSSFFDLLKHYIKEDVNQARHLCEQALAIKQNHSSPCITAKIRHKYGYALDQGGQWDAARREYQQGLREARLCPNDTISPYLLLNLSIQFSNRVNTNLRFRDSCLYYLNAYHAEKHRLSERTQLLTQLKATIALGKAKDFQEALVEGLALKARFDSLPPTHALRPDLHEMLGVLSLETRDIDQAISHFSKALTFATDQGARNDQIAYYQQFLGYLYKLKANAASPDEKQPWLEKAIAVLEKSNEYHRQQHRYDKVLYGLDAIGNAYSQLDDTPRAEASFREGMNLAQEIGDSSYLGSLGINLLAELKKQGRPSADFLPVLQILEPLQVQQSLLNQAVFYDYQAYALEGAGQPREAVSAYQKATSLYSRAYAQKDSILNANHIQQLKEQEVRFATQQKEKEIAYLKQVDDNRRLTVQRQRLFLLLISLFLLATMAILFLINRNRIRAQNQKIILEELNQKLKKSETNLKMTNEKLSRFAHSFSHDIFSKLDLILSNSNIAEQRLQQQKTNVTPLLANITNHTRWLKSYGQELLLWAHQDEPNPVCTVSEVVLDVLSSLKDEIQPASITTHNLDVRVLMGPIPLKQVLYNLLTNALQHNRERSINLQIRVAARTSGTQASIFVEDNGVGISQEDKERILNSKKNTRHGLRIVQYILTKHDSVLHIAQSDLGGACFSFTLPTDPKETDHDV